MKAVVWRGREDVRVESVPDPRIEEPTDAVVRITSTAICGSDLHLYSKLWPVMKAGDIIGHEPMGIVEEVGSAVTGLQPGDRVVVPFTVACGRCFQCGIGMQSQCETTQNKSVRKGASLFGYTHLYGALPGGQAELLRVPHADYGPVKVPDGASDTRFLFLSDVLPTAWQAVEYGDVPEGGTVAVFGLGPIGQMCTRIAWLRGAARVIGVDQVPERLVMAERHGVEAVDFSKVDDITDELWARTDGRGVDSSIDAVGMEAAGSVVDSVLQTVKLQPDKLVALHQAMGVVRRGGTLSISGVYGGHFPLFPLGDLFDKQVTIRMGQANVRRWTDDILSLLAGEGGASGAGEAGGGGGDPFGLDDFVTHEVPLDDAPDAYVMFQRKADGCLKVVLRP